MSDFEEYIDYLKSKDIANLRCEIAALHSKLSTTNLMSRLRHRHFGDSVDDSIENPYDVLFIRLYGKRKPYYLLGELVVMYFPPAEVRKSKIDKLGFIGGMTFTEMKKGSSLKWEFLCERRDGRVIELSDGRKMKVWDKPYILRATTKYDKDFRKEWEDGFLVYEGNEYGDTSDFHIIGNILTER